MPDCPLSVCQNSCTCINKIHHDISTHVVHHLFPQVRVGGEGGWGWRVGLQGPVGLGDYRSAQSQVEPPHYLTNLCEPTEAAKAVLGPRYLYDRHKACHRIGNSFPFTISSVRFLFADAPLQPVRGH